MKKVFRMAVTGLLAASGFMLASAAAPVHASTITIRDALGRNVTTPNNPQRIIGVGAGALRMIAYLQATDRLVGIEANEYYYTISGPNPPGASIQSQLSKVQRIGPGGPVVGRPYAVLNQQMSKLPSIGTGGPGSRSRKPDMEAVLAARPDVIFMTATRASLADEIQKTLNIPVVALSQGKITGSFDNDLLRSLRIAGKILKKEQRAEAVVRYINSVQADLQKRVKGQPRKTAYVGAVNYAGSHGLEGSAKDYIPFDWLGVINPVKHLPATTGSHIKLEKEMMLKLNPPVIFLDTGGLHLVEEDMRKNPNFYSSLQAFQKRQVYRLYPFVNYDGNPDTAMLDAYAVGKVLYPKQFADINLPTKADEIYRFMLGKPHYKNMENSFGVLGAPYTPSR